LASAALAWAVLILCRRRPGRIGPRIWAVCLAGLTTLFALLALVFPGRSWPLTLVIAGLAATLALTPRLYPLRPDSALLQRIAPLALLLVPAAVLLATWGAQKAIASATERRVDRQIQELRLWTTEIQEATGSDWSLLERNPEEAERQVD